MNHTVQQLKSQSELWGRGELKISDQKEIILRWRTKEKKRTQRVVRWPWTALACFIFQLTPSSTINSHLRPCYTAACPFTRISMSLQIHISLKMWSSGKLRKAFISIRPPKNLLVSTGKPTHGGRKGCYTMERHASTPWITQHKHQHFITQNKNELFHARIFPIFSTGTSCKE